MLLTLDLLGRHILPWGRRVYSIESWRIVVME
jgi:hypothetical protein